MVKYSFVIPVYNVEKYLSECVESILNQTYRDFEIILVDDGATDASAELCDEYANKYESIISIHQKNAGASVARNTGLNASNGEYVVYLDSDDFWCEKTALEEIDNLFTPGVDIVAFSSKNMNDKTKECVGDRYDYPESMNSLNPEQSLVCMVSNDLLNMHTAKRVYKKAFLIDNNLFFKPGIRSEDVELGFRIFNCLPVIRFLNKKIYVYRHHEDSVTTTIGEKHLKEYLGIITSFADFSFKNETVDSCLKSYLAYQYALLIAFVYNLKPQNKKELKKELKQYRYLFKYTMYPRTRLISKFNKLFGFNITGMFLGFYLGRKH